MTAEKSQEMGNNPCRFQKMMSNSSNPYHSALVTGVTIQGVAQLISGLIYVALAQFFTLSSSGVFTLSVVGQGIAAVVMLFHPSLSELIHLSWEAVMSVNY